MTSPTEYPLEIDEMNINELRTFVLDKETKVRIVQEQLAALSIPSTLELVYYDGSGNVAKTERSEWLELYYELLGETKPI